MEIAKQEWGGKMLYRWHVKTIYGRKTVWAEDMCSALDKCTLAEAYPTNFEPHKAPNPMERCWCDRRVTHRR